MPINFQPLMDSLIEISEVKGMKVAVTESLKGGAITGASAFAGGVILGPIGLALGGILGGFASSVLANGKFKSVALILRDLKPKQKNKLCNNVMAAFKDFGMEDVIVLASLILSNDQLKTIAIREVSNFLRQEMNLNVL